MSETSATLYANVTQVLRIGFRIAAGLLILGLAVAVVRQEPLERETNTLSEIPSSLANLHSAAFIDLAIITMVITPVVAVVAIYLGFRQSGERFFARCAAGVLAILGCSIVLAIIR